MRHQAWQQGGDSVVVTADVTDTDYALPTLEGGENPRYVSIYHDSNNAVWVKFGPEGVLSDDVGFLLNGGLSMELQKFNVGGHTHFAVTSTSGDSEFVVTPLAD